jgi:hypothetical protein
MIRAAQPLGACPGGRAPRQNWGKFEAHKWGGFTGRLDGHHADAERERHYGMARLMTAKPLRILLGHLHRSLVSA